MAELEKNNVDYAVTEVAPTPHQGSVVTLEAEKMGVEDDRRDMLRMGKKQEMRVRLLCSLVVPRLTCYSAPFNSFRYGATL